MCFWKCTKMFFVNFQMCQNVIPMLSQCFQNVHFCTSGSGGVLNVRKCSAMYFNLYSTFPSAIYLLSVSLFHFTWFLVVVRSWLRSLRCLSLLPLPPLPPLHFAPSAAGAEKGGGKCALYIHIGSPAML